ncbi:LAME_0H00892g1_1 [Lachancea meyersii CBS 8951]|uniref:LAME_0H00892g1_1 n=1 Tax=Lachancea meyersii CBS 8951 TaxID=1266667 RepID=A0A1G4KDB1_9SACH|nr:LAME_0H00892g1_1 [Lachancea meyersii CBS 8951]
MASGKLSKKQLLAKNGDLTNEDDAYDAIFSGNFGSMEIGNYIGPNDGQTEHLPDAVDFEDEDELADEELPEETQPSHENGAEQDNDDYLALMGGQGAILGNNNHGACDDQNNTLFLGVGGHEGPYPEAEHHVFGGFADENQLELEEKQKREEQERAAREEKELLEFYFPKFQKGKALNLLSIVPRQLAQYQWQRELYLTNRHLRPFIPLKVKFEVQPDSRRLFKAKNKNWQSMTQLSKRKKRGLVTVPVDEMYGDNVTQVKLRSYDGSIPKELMMMSDDWDYDKIVGDSDTESSNTGQSLVVTEAKNISNSRTALTHGGPNWDEENLIEGKVDQNKVCLDMNDEKLLFVPSKHREKKDSNTKTALLAFNEKTLAQKFNISNDHKYKILKENYQTKIRSTISNLTIEHSQPALRLQSPFYKVLPPKNAMRNFHRPHFGSLVRPGTNIVFSKIKTRKRKRDKGKDVRELFSRSQDLTLGDSAPIFLMEYSEEIPMALSKFGMGNKLINYYRKTDDRDASRPKLPVGETHVLGVQDKSPFWNFGFVEPGNVVPTLYNNMIRAPVFKHEVSRTDFLLVRSTGNGMGNRFYLRHINHLFTVGQTFPVVEVPGPNSRKVTSMGKNRLRMIVYRILNKSIQHRLLVKQVARHFPDQNDMQNRQRLKEFMKYQRDGDDHGFWKLKESETLPDNESVKKMIIPEDVSLTESMYQGQQFQDDNEQFNVDEKLIKLEENLIPWAATKNFLNATQMRAMVQIHGAGDPTGCGEGFSLLKTSMKGGFTRSGSDLGQQQIAGGHSYNVAQQQKAYEEEISKTWYTQAKSLRVTNPFEEIENPDFENKTNKKVKSHRSDNKVLRVVRKTRDENGIIQRQTVVIRDPRVIQGYIKAYERKRQEAEANLGLEELMNDNIDLVSGGNTEEKQLKQKKLLEEQLAKLQKSQERRQARKLAKEKTKDGKVTKSKSTNRRCATCGMVGHIRTKKTCPMYNGSTGPGMGGAAATGALSESAPGTPAEVKEEE